MLLVQVVSMSNLYLVPPSVSCLDPQGVYHTVL